MINWLKKHLFWRTGFHWGYKHRTQKLHRPMSMHKSHFFTSHLKMPIILLQHKQTVKRRRSFKAKSTAKVRQFFFQNQHHQRATEQREPSCWLLVTLPKPMFHLVKLTIKVCVRALPDSKIASKLNLRMLFYNAIAFTKKQE